jgi:hypothetical protein
MPYTFKQVGNLLRELTTEGNIRPFTKITRGEIAGIGFYDYRMGRAYQDNGAVRVHSLDVYGSPLELELARSVNATRVRIPAIRPAGTFFIYSDEERFILSVEERIKPQWPAWLRKPGFTYAYCGKYGKEKNIAIARKLTNDTKVVQINDEQLQKIRTFAKSDYDY